MNEELMEIVYNSRNWSFDEKIKTSDDIYNELIKDESKFVYVQGERRSGKTLMIRKAASYLKKRFNYDILLLYSWKGNYNRLFKKEFSLTDEKCILYFQENLFDLKIYKDTVIILDELPHDQYQNEQYQNEQYQNEQYQNEQYQNLALLKHLFDRTPYKLSILINGSEFKNQEEYENMAMYFDSIYVLPTKATSLIKN